MKKEYKTMGKTLLLALAAKALLVAAIMIFLPQSASAQKFALLDMDYILKNIPAYERANEQLTQISKKWQAEVEAIQTEAQSMSKNYQHHVVILSEEKKERQHAVMKKEREAAELKKKYFGPDGELVKKRNALIAPIQELVYNAVSDVAESRGYQLVLDRASDSGIIYGSPRIDISDDVLSRLGSTR